MIKKISLNNFKSFRKMEDLKLSGLTVIVGKNSCGKTSILQSLLLLKQSLESSSDSHLCLDGKYLKLSNINEITYGLPKVNSAKLGFGFEVKNNSFSGRIQLGFKNKRINDYYEPRLEFCRINTDVDDEKGSNEFDIVKLTKSKIKKIVERFNFLKNSNETVVDYEIGYKAFIPYLLTITLEDDSGKRRKQGLPFFFVIPEDQAKLLEEFESSLRKIRYLGPVRATPERAYVHYSSDTGELNEIGSNAAHILWAKQNEEVFLKDKSYSLKDAVNECITCMGLSQQISPDKIGEILYKVGIKEISSGKNVSLADVGFGYSQILPVILMGLINNKDNLILLEQPEIHLHPSSAANLADLFLNFIQDNKRFVIETHSTELINRLRLRVIENPELKEKINIVFVESNFDEGTQIKQFSIDENGMFPEWPEGFLDESEKLAEAMLEARLSRC